MDEGQLQIHLTTKQAHFAVPDTPYSIQASVTSKELNSLIFTLLQENASSAEVYAGIEFDFLVKGEFLKATLGKHLRDRSVSFEEIIEIEYVERYPAPEPQDCLLHDDWVSAIHATDEFIATGCYDNSVNVWNMKGEHKLTVMEHEAPVKAIGWISVDDENGIGRMVSGSKDQTLKIWEWNVRTAKATCLFTCKGHERAVECLEVSPNKQQVASGGWDNLLKVWSTSTIAEGGSSMKKSKTEEPNVRTPIMTLEGHREAVSCVQWIDNSTIVSSSWDHTIKIWDLQMKAMKSEIPGNKSFFDISYSHLNGTILAASADKNIRMFDPRSQHGAIVKFTYLGHSQWVQSVAWSKDEEHLFISGAYDHQVKLWDSRSSKAPLFDLVGHEDKVMAVDWSNPKYMLSGGADNSLRIFKSKKVVKNVEE